MSYNIETRSVTEFVTDTRIKLPRFQRKSTWTAKQNFELAISIFQEYPVGVVIINEENQTSWLLDGRQRRTALRDLRANPDLVYDWARKYIGFKPSESTDDLKTLFWGKVEAYLQSEEQDDPAASDDLITDETEDVDIDKERQMEGLNTLLNTILMAHQKKHDVGQWCRTFDMKTFLDRPTYAPKRDGYKVNPVELRKFILSQIVPLGELTKESFIQCLDDQCGIIEGQEVFLSNYVSQHWDEITHIVDVIDRAEKIFTKARVGVILLKNVTPLDAQNIFSRINSGGTQLKAEELLSAKPFWNVPVQVQSARMSELVKEMYKRLGVEVPEGVVRWDYGATLISRLNDKHLLFDPYQVSAATKEIDMTQVTLGFKMISSYFSGGMSAVDVSAIERNKDIQWGVSIDDLIEDANIVCEILLKCDFFKYLKRWNKSIYKLMGSAIVLEFITILIKDWEEKGRPKTASKELNNFLQDAKCLFDRLVYEYAIGAWRGSGDSKMAKHIKNWHERLDPVKAELWNALVEGACEGSFNGQSFDIKHLTPILCYEYALLRRSPDDVLEETSEVDHIIPQAKLEGNKLIPTAYKDALFNLTLLPKAENIAKKDKTLKEITTQSLKETISKYTGIDLKDFEKYSDIANIEDLKKERTAVLMDAFSSKRLSELSNS